MSSKNNIVLIDSERTLDDKTNVNGKLHEFSDYASALIFLKQKPNLHVNELYLTFTNLTPNNNPMSLISYICEQAEIDKAPEVDIVYVIDGTEDDYNQASHALSYYGYIVEKLDSSVLTKKD